MYILLLFLILAHASFANRKLYDGSNNDCYATPNVYDKICIGTGPVIPHPSGLTMGYEIQVDDEVDTEVCCKARGWDGEKTIWVEFLCNRNIIKGSVPWVYSKDQKAIQCKGTPLGAHLTWI